MPLPFERLPKNVVPKVYDITIKPDLINFKFNGKVKIECDVQEATSEVSFNALDMEISNVEYKRAGDKEIEAENIEMIPKEEKVIVGFPSPLPLGKGYLSMDFIGNLNDQMKGLYRSKYMVDGEERYAAVSQLATTDTRRAFPCWDEPAIKAVFNVTLIVPKDRVALSNMNVTADDIDSTDPSLKIVKFAPSPIMSAYLVAFIIGEYDYIEDTSKDGVLVRVYTPVGKAEQGRFSLEVATKVLSFYEDYFKISYPLPKLDLIAVADLCFGAMENWGLITFRESRFLFDPKHSSTTAKQSISTLVGHEIAHQWFGNLVTMEWWTHIWLNEGFATFMQFLVIDHVIPEYNIWTQFVTDVFTVALGLDALKNSHPIEVPIGHPSEIDEILDAISYKKGASIIRMLHDFIGDKHFKEGLHDYLTKFSYNNTCTEDLWNALDKASGQPVGKIMQSWTKQTGFPLISVSSFTNGNERTLKISQSYSGGAKWVVPISFSTQANPKTVIKKIFLENDTIEVKFENIPANHWIKLNPGTVGFYRVQYSSEMLKQFFPSISDQTLPALDRLGLQNDLFAMIKMGKTSTVDVLKFMEAYANETDYTVWASISQCLGALKLLLDYTDSLPLLCNFVCKLYSKIYAVVGWDPKPNESHFNVLLRSLAINQLVSFQDSGVLKEAKKRFMAHIEGTATIFSDLRDAVYEAVVSQGEEKIFNQMIELHNKTDLQEEKNRISFSLGAVKDKKLLEKVLKFALSDNVRSQDAIFVLIAAAKSKQGRLMSWNFFKENKDEFRKRYDGGVLISRLVKGVAENFCSEEVATDVKEFFQANPFYGAEMSVEQSLESIDINRQWLARDADNIAAWLQSKK